MHYFLRGWTTWLGGLSVAAVGLCVVWLALSVDQRIPSPYTSHELDEVVRPIRAVGNNDIEEAIIQAVANQAWEDVLSEIKRWHVRVLPPADKILLHRDSTHAARKQAVRADVIAKLESQRSFLSQIAAQVKGNAPDPFLSQLSYERIVVNFRLIAVHDLQVAKLAWSDYPWDDHYGSNDTIDWFWEDVAAAEDYYKPLSGYDWRSRQGIPIDELGNPVFVDVPADFTSDLGCGEKILFLAGEIEQLDATPEKHHAGRILLYRARLARRLFGPARDAEWDIHFYDMQHRPSFVKKDEVKGLKPVHELADDESRLQVGMNTAEVKLPEVHSPLALYRQLEQRYPNCDSLPRAMYEIGQYYQMRRQFKAAIREYERVLEKFPEHQRGVLAQQQMDLIRHPSVLLGRTGVFPSGTQPQVWFTYRNASAIEFTLRKLDTDQFLADQVDGKGFWRYAPFIVELDGWSRRTDEYKNAGKVVATWQADVEASLDAATSSTLVPHNEIGEYMLEARIPGTEQVSQAILSITSVAIVHESQADQTLLTVVDALAGERLANETLQVVRYDRSLRKNHTTTYESNAAGEITIPSDEEGQTSYVYLRSEKRGRAFLTFKDSQVYSQDEAPIVATYTVTDRPAYRPGERVQFRAWYRQEREQQRLACPEIGKALQIVMFDPRSNICKTLELHTDETGSVAGDIELGNETALGLYKLFVRSAEQARRDADPYWIYSVNPSAQFRVEEFKRPEFKLLITPQTNPSEMEVAFDLQANYYFGEPVAGGDVEYSLYRRFKPAAFSTPQPFDWLYGAGYGRYNYLYPWLGDSPAAKVPTDEQGWGAPDPRGREVVSGAMKLDASGHAVVRFDASQLSTVPNYAMQFTLQAEVRDDSRRSISADGEFTVADRSFYTIAELDHGWYRTGEPVHVNLATRDANSQAISSAVSVELLRVAPVNAADAAVSAEQLDRRDVVTAVDGPVSVAFDDLPVGQYRVVVYVDDGLPTNDTSEVPDRMAAAVNFVVYGDGINDSLRRFGDLEIIPNASTYRPGETAQILINTNRPPLQLLLEDSLGTRRTVQLAAQSTVIEIPITAECTPSVCYRASTVRDGKLIKERFDLYVPPVEHLLHVAVEADSDQYQPGEEATVTVAVTDNNGEPVSGDVVLNAYDASVLAIQPELGIGPKQMLLETKPSVWAWEAGEYSSSLGMRQFDADGVFLSPEYSLASELFYGPWSPDEQLTDGGDPAKITPRRSIAMGGMGGSGPEHNDLTPAEQSGATTQAVTDDFAGSESDLENDDPNAARRQYVPPVVRRNESATAAWLPRLRLDEQGRGQATIPLPDSLTTWKLRAHSITAQTQLGDGSAELVTSKPLLVRLQTPRFLIEQDQVTISANVHNGLASEKEVRVELYVPQRLLQPVEAEGKAGDKAAADSVDAAQDGLVRLVREQRIAAGERQRFDWTLKATQSGTVQITVKAMTDEPATRWLGSCPSRRLRNPSGKAKRWL